MKLGEIIRLYRETNKVSLDEFAKKCGLSKGYVSMIENGINPRNRKPIAPTLISINKIASGLSISTDELLKMLDSNQPVSLAPEDDFSLSFIEKDIILSYRTADDIDQQMVRRILHVEEKNTTILKAAHARTDINPTVVGKSHDDIIMNDDNEWK